MKILNILKNDIDKSEKDNFELGLINNNIRRGKILAIVVIVFEVILLLIDIITSILKVDSRFQFNAYFAMYLIMILINAAYLLFIRKFTSKDMISKKQKDKFDVAIIVYLTLIMSWGSVISLMDQKLYGQLMAFMVNIMVCSIIYLLNNKKILIPYCISVLILVVGLPSFQNSKDILIGHYVNIVAFVIISWLASRISYHNFCENYSGKMLVNKSNLLLEEKIKENKEINQKLIIANEQLKKLTLMDELTGIPNRRSFWEFIDSEFQYYFKNSSTISIIMIDIDFFKQFNDYYGHEEGDKTLISVANQINSIVADRAEFVVRWGGEEFIYVAFNKNEEIIKKTAKMISKKVTDLKINHNDSLVNTYITVSLGCYTTKLNEKKDVDNAIALADRSLYSAKNSGRNCVKFSSDEVIQ